jgi:hypothetical protein
MRSGMQGPSRKDLAKTSQRPRKDLANTLQLGVYTRNYFFVAVVPAWVVCFLLSGYKKGKIGYTRLKYRDIYYITLR